MNELKPCPFCGCKDVVMDRSDEACSAVVADFEALPDADVRPVVRGYEVVEEDEKPIRTSIMQLDEAIQHLEAIIPQKDWSCKDCKQEHEQLLEWLIELEERRKQDQKEASMDKPLKDWTLGEAQAYCAKMNDTCNGCWFLHDGECGLEAAPKDWDLTAPPRVTEEEMERANAILTLFPGADELKKTDTGHVRVGRNECIVSMLFNDLFPSILPGQTVKLSDILGAPNTERR